MVKVKKKKIYNEESRIILAIGCKGVKSHSMWETKVKKMVEKMRIHGVMNDESELFLQLEISLIIKKMLFHSINSKEK